MRLYFSGLHCAKVSGKILDSIKLDFDVRVFIFHELLKLFANFENIHSRTAVLFTCVI